MGFVYESIRSDMNWTCFTFWLNSQIWICRLTRLDWSITIQNESMDFDSRIWICDLFIRIHFVYSIVLYVGLWGLVRFVKTIKHFENWLDSWSTTQKKYSWSLFDTNPLLLLGSLWLSNHWSFKVNQLIRKIT